MYSGFHVWKPPFPATKIFTVAGCIERNIWIRSFFVPEFLYLFWWIPVKEYLLSLWYGTMENSQFYTNMYAAGTQYDPYGPYMFYDLFSVGGLVTFLIDTLFEIATLPLNLLGIGPYLSDYFCLMAPWFDPRISYEPGEQLLYYIFLPGFMRVFAALYFDIMPGMNVFKDFQ